MSTLTPPKVFVTHPIIFLDLSDKNKESVITEQINCTVKRSTSDELYTIAKGGLLRKTLYYINENIHNIHIFFRTLRLTKPSCKLIVNVPIEHTSLLTPFLEQCSGILVDNRNVETWLNSFESAIQYPHFFDSSLHRDLLNRYRYMTTDNEDVNELIVNKDQAKELLSEAEFRVFYEMATGKSNKQISQALFLEISTVNNHISQINKKLNAHSKTHAIKRAIEKGLISIQSKRKEIV